MWAEDGGGLLGKVQGALHLGPGNSQHGVCLLGSWKAQGWSRGIKGGERDERCGSQALWGCGSAIAMAE